MFKGTPMVVHQAQHLANNGVAHTQQARTRAASEVHRRMREKAEANPAWNGMADGIYMYEQPTGDFVYGFDPAHPLADRAAELEFGSEENRPSSVFRSVLAGQHDSIQRNYRAELQGWRNA